jgi:hypothetical protein
MAQEVRYFLTQVNRYTSKEGQKENDAEVLIERNGGCSSIKLEYLPMTLMQRPFLRVVQEGLLCPLLSPLLCGLL